jgi:hypothetical protein
VVTAAGFYRRSGFLPTLQSFSSHRSATSCAKTSFDVMARHPKSAAQAIKTTKAEKIASMERTNFLSVMGAPFKFLGKFYDKAVHPAHIEVHLRRQIRQTAIVISLPKFVEHVAVVFI